MHMTDFQRNHNFISQENDFIRGHCGASMFHHTTIRLSVAAAAAQGSHGVDATLTAASLHYLQYCCLSTNELNHRTSTLDQRTTIVVWWINKV